MPKVDLKPENYMPAKPERTFKIGLVGCGNIARSAHLKSYAHMGFEVVHACDIDEENLKLAVEEFDIPRGTLEMDELLADPEVEVVDLAVHATQRLPLVTRIAAAGKPGRHLTIFFIVLFSID